MSIWNILGIEQTKDKEELKKAYRRSLNSVNPEDDAQGFMQLRRAYEEAIKLADTVEEASAEPKLQGVEAAIDAIYQDFDRRIAPDSWIELFNTDEFVALDTSEESFDILMGYITQNFHLPGKIYKLIVDTFDIKENKKELSEKYPSDFIDYMLNNATYDDLIDYYMFDGDSSYFDEYITKFYELNKAYRVGDEESAKRLMEELAEMDVYHPYFDILQIKYKLHDIGQRIEKKRLEAENMGTDVSEAELTDDERLYVYELKGDACMLRDEFPEDITILICIAELAELLGDYDEAEELYEEGLRIDADNYELAEKQAQLWLMKKEYVKARDAFVLLLRRNHYDNRGRAGMIRANQFIIEQNKAKLAENPEDKRAKLEIAWSCYQSYMFDEGLRMLESFYPDEEDRCEYHNVKGRTYLCMMDYDAALENFYKWKKCIEELPDENEIEDEEARKKVSEKKKRYPYVNFLIAHCYLKTGNYKKAQDFLAVSLSTEHDELALSLEADCELKFELKEYNECINACEKLIEKEDRNYVAYMYKAKACLELNYLKDCLAAAEKAVVIYPYTYEAHVVEIKLYHKIAQLDSAMSIIERYEGMGIRSDNILYYKAITYDLMGEKAKAIELLENICSEYVQGKSDLENLEEVQITLGDFYDKADMDDKAMDCYRYVIEHNPKHQNAYGCLAYMYKKKGEYRKALDYFSKQLEYNQHPLYYINRGILNKYFDNYKSALYDFQNAIKYDERNAFCYSRIGIIYQMHREYDKAIENFDLALGCVAPDDKELIIEIHKWKARSFACKKEYKQAIDILRAVLDKYGDENIYVRYELAGLLVRDNRVAEAEGIVYEFLNSVTDKTCKVLYLRFLLDLYKDEGRLKETKDIFSDAVAIAPNDHKLYAYMARAYMDAGKYDKAIEMFVKATDIDKKCKENYYSELIEALCAKSRMLKPVIKEYMTKAVIDENDIHSPREHVKMARLYRALKRYKDAESQLKKAMNMRRCESCDYCSCEEALYERVLLLEAQKNYDDAIACCRQLLAICGHNALYERKLKTLIVKRK